MKITPPPHQRGWLYRGNDFRALTEKSPHPLLEGVSTEAAAFGRSLENYPTPYTEGVSTEAAAFGRSLGNYPTPHELTP